MRCLFFGCLLLLCSCSGVSSVNDIANATINNVTAIEKTLPSECKSESVIASLGAIKSEVKSIVSVCDTEKKVLQNKIAKLNVIILALCGALVGALFAFLKRYII